MRDKGSKRKEGRLNDQKPKPLLGNTPNMHGGTNVDVAGGSGPSKNRPVKTNRKGY
jgi:hypothetical protein